MTKKADEPAFPCPTGAAVPLGSKGTGVTKRELFAAMAMQGLLADDDVRLPDIGAAAVKQADALLVALEGEGDE